MDNASLAWLDKYIAEQRCNVEIIEAVTGMSMNEVCDMCDMSSFDLDEFERDTMRS